MKSKIGVDYARVRKFAHVLYAMHVNGQLRDPDFRPVVGALVREAMETKLPHCTTAYRTRKAAELIKGLGPSSRSQYHRLCKAHLRHEHMVPTKVRIDMLLGTPELTEERIVQSLVEFGLRATIHIEEDDRLNELKLKSAMPKSFSTPDDAQYMNPLARYVHANLHGELIARQGKCWFDGPQDA